MSFAVAHMHLANAVQGAQQDLIQVAVVEQVRVVIDHMLHHRVHLHTNRPY